MGVKGLLEYLRKRNVAILQKCSLAEFKGYRIAVDVAILAYKMKYQFISKMSDKIDFVNEDLDYDACLNYMNRNILKVIDGILSAGCVPVIVFDGPPLALKKGTKAKRYDELTRKKFVISELRRLYKGLSSGSDFILTSNDVEFLKSFKPAIEDLEGIKQTLLKQIKQLVEVSSEDYQQLSFILTALGVPNFRAQCEAEKTCSQMVKHKDAIALLTTDSDALMYACPIVITKYTSGTGIRVKTAPTLECYTFTNVLEVLDLTHSQFVDFCIMCGTDFNDNSPGYGVESNYLLIKTYGSIAKMKEEKSKLALKLHSTMTKAEKMLFKYEFEILNYNEVRNYVTTPPTYNKDCLKIRHVEDQYEKVVDCLSITMGDRKFNQISDLCKNIVAGLSAVSKFCKCT